jgi:hypothetical protein
MSIRIEIRTETGEELEAVCPDIGISCRGETLEEVLDRMKDLLVFYFSTVTDNDMTEEEQGERIKELGLYFKGKNLFLPRDPKVH